MALTENERAVFKAFFNYLPEDEVMSLAQTVTENNIVISGREDAVQAILNFSPSSESILRRKKVKTEYLVKFMHDNKVPFHEKLEKSKLIRRFLDNLPSNPPSLTLPNPLIVEEVHQPSAPPQHLVDDSFSAAFVTQFVPWFVELFNNGPPQLGMQHFWTDSQLRVTISNEQLPQCCLTATGAETVCAKLTALHSAGTRLAPAPAGHCADMDRFGRVTLRLSGTMHHASVGGPAGLFQLSLGLMEDTPVQTDGRERRYKIKFLYLEISSSIDPNIIFVEQICG